MPLAFTAHCQRGHDRVDFTDRAAFERHMRQTHKAKPITTGAACYNGSARIPAHDRPRPGGLPNKYLRPNRAPKTTEGLTKILAAAADEYVHHGRGVGSVHPVIDWSTDELVTLEDVRTGDVFRFGRHEYTCHDRAAWLVTGGGATEPTRPRNIEDRLGATVIIVKRAA